MTEEKTKCEVREGRFIDPCKFLQEATDIHQPAFSRAKSGLFRTELYNRNTGEMSRSYHGMRTKKYPRGGVLMNYCPFCGTCIQAPFYEDETTEPEKGETP